MIWMLARWRKRSIPIDDPSEWPELTLLLPVHNEARAIRGTLESLLALDYPPALKHILVVSDASEDGTNAIVGEYADRGVRLVSLPTRSGKTGAENAAEPELRGSL